MGHFQLLMAANYEMQERMRIYAQNAEIVRHVLASFHEQLAESRRIVETLRQRLEAVESGLCTTRETGAVLSLVGLAEAAPLSPKRARPCGNE